MLARSRASRRIAGVVVYLRLFVRPQYIAEKSWQTSMQHPATHGLQNRS